MKTINNIDIESSNIWDALELFGFEGCIVEGEGKEIACPASPSQEYEECEDYMLHTLTGKFVWGERKRPANTFNQWGISYAPGVIESEVEKASVLSSLAALEPEEEEIEGPVYWSFKEERINRFSRILSWLNSQPSKKVLMLAFSKFNKTLSASRARCAASNNWEAVYLTTEQAHILSCAFNGMINGKPSSSIR